MFDKMTRIAVIAGLLMIALGFLDQQAVLSQTCSPAPVGLTSWWQGEGNTLDSRSRNNGAFVGNAGFAPGQVGQAFNFINPGGSVEVPDNPNLNVSGSFAAEAWIFPRSFPNPGPRIFDKDNLNASRWVLDLDGTGVLSVVITSGIGTQVSATANASVPLNQWSHVAFTYSRGTSDADSVLTLFIDGVPRASANKLIGPQTNTVPLRIGNDDGSGGPANPRNFDGLIDEPAVYNRALSQSEILAIVNSGAAGKCQPTATAAPSGLVSWWSGDGHTNDIQGGNSPSQINGSPQFAVARVGQALQFDGNSGLVVPDNPTLNFGIGSFSLEMWTRIDTLPGANGAVLFEKRDNIGQGYVLSMDNTGFSFTVRGNSGAATVQTPAVSVGGFHHLAIAVDRTTNNNVTVYLDGIAQAVSPSIASIGNTNNSNRLFIGQNSTESGTTAGAFNGVIDELSLYNSALMPGEITSIFNAGLAGKLKQGATAIGTSVNTNVGSDATITFSNVTTPGTTQQVPLGLVGLPVLPAGFASTGLVYDIATSASVGGNTTVCFNLPALDSVTRNQSRIFHEEGGSWVNRTTSTNPLCASVTSLSPFIIAHDPSLPTAAPATISGKVTGADGLVLAGVVIRLSGQRSAITVTNAAGNYHFDNVDTDNFYTVTPSLVNYHFAPASRSFSLVGNKTDAVFTASPDASVSANPVDTTEFFVRQQYLDFLGREPDPGGFEYWSDQINRCSGDAVCIHARRVDVSAAFFIEPEAQQTGSYIYDMYAGSLKRQPAFAEYAVDRQQVVGGANLEAQKTAFVQSFVQRAEFTARYQANTTAASFVDALLQNVQSSGVDLGGVRTSLISAYNAGADLNEGRASVLRAVADNATFKQSQYNAAFVLTEYFSYLRRDAEPDGFNFWLNVLNNGDPQNYRGMVCSFITSAEYQRRFGSLVTHSNAECGR